jgi:hypothetical protein
VLAVALAGGAGSTAPPATPRASGTPAPLLTTGLGRALRVGPAEATHHVGLLANGAGAVGVALAGDGSFLAFTCGMRANAAAWYAGDWYRGRLVTSQPVEVAGPDRERLRLARAPDGRLDGTLAVMGHDPVAFAAAPAGAGDGLFRRDDADGVLGAVALPGNAVCAGKRTVDGRFLPAGTVPY